MACPTTIPRPERERVERRRSDEKSIKVIKLGLAFGAGFAFVTMMLNWLRKKIERFQVQRQVTAFMQTHRMQEG